MSGDPADLIEHPPEGEPLGVKVERMTEAMVGLTEEFAKEKRSRRVLSALVVVVAILAIVGTTVGVWLGARSHSQSNQQRYLLEQFVADRNQRRIDACNSANEVRASTRGLVELDRQSSLILVQVLADPALRAASGGTPRTPEQQAATEQALQAFTTLYTQATAQLRQQVLDGLQPLDCSPAALGVAGGQVVTDPEPTSTAPPPAEG